MSVDVAALPVTADGFAAILASAASPSRKTYSNELMDGIRVVRFVAGAQPQLECEFTVAERHLNGLGSVHGGAYAYLTDMLTGCFVSGLSLAHGASPENVSVSISVKCHRPAGVGQRVLARMRVTKYGRSLAFATIDFVDATRDGADGAHTRSFASGEHVLFIPSGSRDALPPLPPNVERPTSSPTVERLQQLLQQQQAKL